MKKELDTLIIIPNQKILSMMQRNKPFLEVYKKSDEVLYTTTQKIVDNIKTSGSFNMQFEGVKI